MIENDDEYMDEGDVVATYCICGEAFESDMIKCDNESCRI